MSYKLLGNALGLAVLLGFSAPSLAQNFDDTQGYWAEPYINTLASRGIIGGFPNGTFQPNSYITRAQFAAIAVKALNLSTTSGGVQQFRDVPNNYWASGAIRAVSNSGLVTGFPDGTFRPEDQITRAQSLVILAKALKERDQADPNALNSYRDARAVPDWARDSVSRAAAARIIVNYPDAGLIEPNSLATRGEVAALTYQTISRVGGQLPPLTIGLLDGRNNNQNQNNQDQYEDRPNQRLTLERVTIRTPGRLQPGEEVVIRAEGSTRATGTFTIEGVARDLPMEEVENGTYEGRYVVRRGETRNNARVFVTLRQTGSQSITREANRRIVIVEGGNNNGGNNNDQADLFPQITNYTANDTITLPTRIEGRTAPNAQVQIQADAFTSIAGPLGLSQQVLNRQIQADSDGYFAISLQPTTILPRGTRYRITLVATDSQSNRSQRNEIFLVQQ
ncbi:S-layer homology domain-containing protein [Candidatus Cyanaurora vandensis]|uniref:S-layer homology domain-containing protein n=1 Tax=Candidatus Cyanaurora vandensis TaxID=2714958 RepID=UPI00257BB7EE|nr:S-layer homology domain-containing protein [Candidatus Cyanaurora vandensis]